MPNVSEARRSAKSMLLVLNIHDGELRALYVSTACGSYPFSLWLAVARHASWLISYAEWGDFSSARAAALDLEAIRAELLAG